MSRARRIRTLAFAAAVVAALLALVLLSGPYLRLLWLDSLGQAEVFWTRIAAYAVCLGSGFILGLAAVVGNLFLAEQCWPSKGPMSGPVEVEVRGTRVVVIGRPQLPSWLPVAGGLMGGFLMAVASLPVASTWLAFRHQVSFSLEDPLFGYDASFYLFTMPFLRDVLSRLDGALFLGFLAAGLVYLLRGNRALLHAGRVPPGALRHLSGLVGSYLVLRAPTLWLDRLSLCVKGSGLAAGAGYVDAHIRAPGLGLMAIVCLAVGIFLILYPRFERPLVQLGSVAGTALLGVVTLAILPSLVQAYRVRPNEIALERPFIKQGIKFTRTAFGLDQIEEIPYAADEVLTPEVLARYQNTIDNVRLWDAEPARDAYQQLQSLRTYYGFPDVDIDRYEVDGETRQVMLSARELTTPEASKTWINRHLKYTHGYGLALSPVNEANSEGQPKFWVKDLPPEGRPEFTIERPEIYFGERTRWFVLVNTKEPELSYQPVSQAYEGEGGIAVSGALRRLAMSIYFSDPNILLSSAITPDTRLMFDRDIETRLYRLAPFLKQEADPYLVISQGKLYWIVDLYAASDRFPYSKQTYQINYIRNSVKAVIDAYSGEVQLVVVDPQDPLVATYRSIYPSLFVDPGEVDEEIRSHFRYPEYLLHLQAEVFNTYHMTEPEVFYNREDLWQLAQETYAGKTVTVEPYYLVMRLPEEEQPEFILMLPFTPKDKENLNAWLAARCDGDHYGKLILYRFPKERLVYGPSQIEARIKQNTDISQQLTLWDQKGSQALRGNLLVIPIESSLLYVEPLYLQTQGETKIPELIRVIVATAKPHQEGQEDSSVGRVVMRPTLDEALRVAFGEVKPLTTAASVILHKGTAAKALNHIENAERALSRGDWEEFGRQMQRAKRVLRDLPESELEQPASPDNEVAE